MARLRFTILGCGASPGVPRINGDWGECDPNEPKNYRTRASALIERFGDDDDVTRVLIDTGPDLRAQLIAANVHELHAVIYTHAHADHVHGIDDLRAFWMATHRQLPVYSDDDTQSRLEQGFGYCFAAPVGSPYPPFLTRTAIRAGHAFTINGPGGRLTIEPFAQVHGDIQSLGLRVGPVAYSCDFNDLPPDSIATLHGLDVWVLDALRRRPHPSHASLGEALGWITRIAPQRAVLTHMTNELDYQTLLRELPPAVTPAFDGISFEFDLPPG
jgi:phosphoribosyl 1,2-cyclic phosphate phosphodiesterase